MRTDKYQKTNKVENQVEAKQEKVTMKVFRMNENDFVAAQSLSEAKAWYCEETRLSENDAIDQTRFAEIETDKYSMWLSSSEVPEGKKNLIEEIVSNKGDDRCKLLFKHVIEIKGETTPYLIDSIGQ